MMVVVEVLVVTVMVMVEEDAVSNLVERHYFDRPILFIFIWRRFYSKIVDLASLFPDQKSLDECLEIITNAPKDAGYEAFYVSSFKLPSSSTARMWIWKVDDIQMAGSFRPKHTTRPALKQSMLDRKQHLN
jgi:hypothetical protein